MESIRSLFLNYFAALRTACDMSHQITSYLTVCSTTHSCRHQAFTLLTLCEGVGRSSLELNSVNSSPNLTNIMCCIGNDTFAIEYPCKLHVGHSVILCLVDIEHLYRLIQCENVVLISLNRHHMRKFFMPKCYLTPVTQY